MNEKLIKSKKFNLIVTIVILVIALTITVITGVEFKKFSKYQTYFDTSNVSEIQTLNKYCPTLKNTVGGLTEVYILKGPDALNKDIKDCPSILILGGTHPNEPSGQLTATLLLENINVTGDTVVFIMTETNKSAYTHSHPQEASPFYYKIETRSGAYRTFKFGSRATNTNEQWPNPDVYVHPSGQKLSTNDTRNLNRAYPGKLNGTYTEKVAYAITEMIRQNDIKVTIDLHEASPEYITINAIVYHENASKLASAAVIDMDLNDVSIHAEPSPTNLHGLTHRELGDATNTLALLCETSNASQGKIRGAFNESLITYDEKDKFYEKAVALTKEGKEIIYGTPCSINERVARHTFTILSIIKAYNSEVSKSSGFSNLTPERQTLLKTLGKLNITLDLMSTLDAETKMDHLGENQYDLIYSLGVGYFLSDEE